MDEKKFPGWETPSPEIKKHLTLQQVQPEQPQEQQRGQRQEQRPQEQQQEQQLQEQQQGREQQGQPALPEQLLRVLQLSCRQSCR